MAKQPRTPLKTAPAPSPAKAATKAPMPLEGVDPRESGPNADAPQDENLDEALQDAGSSSQQEEVAAPRHRARRPILEEVAVKPTTKAFTITRDDHSQQHYPVGTTSMRSDDASHWYAEAHGVELEDE